MKATNKYNCKSLVDQKIMVQHKRPRLLKPVNSTNKLSNPKCINQLKLSQDINKIQKPFQRGRNNQNIKDNYYRQLMTMFSHWRKIQNIQQRSMILRKWKIKKEHHLGLKLELNQEATFGEGFDNLIENMTYQNKKISLNVYSISESEFIDEIQKLKDTEFVMEQRRFICIMPKLIVYCDVINLYATIPMTNLKMSQLLRSKFQEIDNYMYEINDCLILQFHIQQGQQIGQYHFSIIDLEFQLNFVLKILSKTLKTTLISSPYHLLIYLLKLTFLNNMMLQHGSKDQHVQRMAFY